MGLKNIHITVRMITCLERLSLFDNSNMDILKFVANCQKQTMETFPLFGCGLGENDIVKLMFLNIQYGLVKNIKMDTNHSLAHITIAMYMGIRL